MTNIASRLAAALAERYVLEQELGQGGMATVYCAQDLRHDRKVAIKVVKPELSAVLGPERFLAEIRVTAHLQHPHILPLFDSGSADGLLFYVMPYVEGESLREKLRQERQLPVEEAVQIAREVASALDYAHRHGVIHRDIKPENILLHDGQALVADFGIALAIRAAGGLRFTETGISLGTPHYMSPEQATADRELDGRSDIYSLGCVAYEMLAGEPPHTGSSAQAVIAKIVTEPAPSLRRARSTVPQHVHAAIHRALERLPADRFQSAAQFAEALKHPDSSATAATVAVLASPRRGVPGWLLPLVAAVGILGAGLLIGRRTGQGLAPPPALARFALATGPSHRLSTRPLNAISLSPDGSLIVYMAVKALGGHALFARRIDSLTAHALVGTEEAYNPFFSPDGRWLGFFVGAQMKRMPVGGGTPVSIVDGVFDFARNTVWTESDTILYEALGRGNVIWAVPAGGGTPHPVTSLDTAAGERVHRLADVLPGGKVVLVVTAPSGAAGALVAITMGSGARKTIVPGGVTRAEYSPTGHLVYGLQDGTLLAVPFDLHSLETTGTPTTIAQDLFVAPNGSAQFALSPSGSLVYVPAQPRDLVLVDRHGAAQVISGSPGTFHSPRFSSDGRLVVMDFTRSGSRDVWIQDLKQGTMSRLSFEGDGHDPVWSPDGSRVAYVSGSSGVEGFYVRNADGSGTAQRLLSGHGANYTGAWTPDGTRLISVMLNSGTNFDLYVLPLTAQPTLQSLLATPYMEGYPAISPDGHWLAYATDESGRSEVYVRRFPGSGGRIQISLSGGSEPVWNRNGRELFYRAASSQGSEMVTAAIQTLPTFQVLSRVPLFSADPYETAVPHANYDVDPAGKRFLMVRHHGSSEIMLVQNWAAQLERDKSRR
jgi:eukaryotic-like serine/threonine-protein kinase